MTKAVLIASLFSAIYFIAGSYLLVSIVYATVLLIIIAAHWTEVRWKLLGFVEVLWVVIRQKMILQ